MVVMVFLCVSLGSSTVQLHDSLGRRRACACSGAGFSIQNGDRAWGSVITKIRDLLCVFLWIKVLKAKTIHKEIFPVYSGKCLSRKVVHSWVKKFFQGRSKVADNVRAGRPVEIATETTVQLVGELIRADRSITIDSVATALGYSPGLAYNIMHDRLKFRKVCARWVPRELKDPEKMNRMDLPLQHLLWYADEAEVTSRLNRIVSGNKLWVRHYQLE
jgi:transposase